MWHSVVLETICGGQWNSAMRETGKSLRPKIVLPAGSTADDFFSGIPAEVADRLKLNCDVISDDPKASDPRVATALDGLDCYAWPENNGVSLGAVIVSLARKASGKFGYKLTALDHGKMESATNFHAP